MEEFILGVTKQLATIAIRVKNRNQMIEFYRDLIGFSLKREENELAIMGNQQVDSELLWLEESPRADDYFGETKRLNRLSLAIPSQTELAEILARVTAQNYPIEELVFTKHQIRLRLSDPEGNPLEVHYHGVVDEASDQITLLAQATGESPVLSAVTHFDSIHVNTNQVAKQTAFLNEILGTKQKTLTEVHHLDQLKVTLIEQAEGVLQVPSHKILGLDFLKFYLSANHFEQLKTQVAASEWAFYTDQKGEMFTIYDATGIEWWFVKA
ncbi:MAG: CppA N-terminal domain-containing protein [Enterococcus sp.]